MNKNYINEKTKRTTINRKPQRAHYDQKTIYSIIDSGLICHISYIHEGEPRIIPTAFARIDNELFIHGSRVAGNMKVLATGIMASICITHLDGLVLARSGFNHSMNYRSVIIYGSGNIVDDEKEKSALLNKFTDYIIPGRSKDGLKPISKQDINATTLIRYQLNEMSAKIRTGHPIDDEEDYKLRVWAGVIPISRQFGEPITDPKMRHSIPIPNYVKNYEK